MLEPGQRVVWSPLGAPHVRHYGAFVCKWRDGYVKLVFDGEADEKLFPESEVRPASLLETIAYAAREPDE